jgi:hypothetical protein
MQWKSAPFMRYLTARKELETLAVYKLGCTDSLIGSPLSNPKSLQQ